MIRGQSTSRLAVAGVGAVALILGAAAPALATEGTSINGSGSTLQTTAQQDIWIPHWQSRTELGGSPSVTYHPTSNTEGLKEFGNLTGALKPGEWGLDAYAATDDAPTGEQIGAAESAASSTEITVPVAQEPVVVLLSLPQGISNLEQGGEPATSVDLTNQSLEEIWTEEVPASTSPAYEANTWGALLTDAGYTFASTKKTGATKAIKLIASRSGSGTNYAFKQYLSQLTTTYSDYVNDEDTWPVAVRGGGSSSATETQKVARTPGSIGYAYLVDAVDEANGGFSAIPTSSSFEGSESHLTAYALVQDNGTSTSSPIFASPVSGESTVANVDLYYGVGTPGNYGKVGLWLVPEAPNGSWAGTYASDPSVYQDADAGEAYYPIVAVTYDLAWGSYVTPQLERKYGGSSTAALVGNTAFDYMEYVLNGGQSRIEVEGDYYAALPVIVENAANRHQIPAINGGA